MSFSALIMWHFALVEYVCSTPTIAEDERIAAVATAMTMLHVEQELGIPEHMLGMSVAAASVESGFNAAAKGDHKFSRRGRPKAIGVLQLWPWVEKYDVDREDVLSSTHFWLGHIQRVKKKTDRQCRSRHPRTQWRQAWVTAVRYPKPSGRCREKPRHWRHFLRLRRIYARFMPTMNPALPYSSSGRNDHSRSS